MDTLTRLRKTFGYTLGLIIQVQGMIWIKRYLDKNIIDQTAFFFNKEYLYINFKFFLWMWLILFAWSFTDDFWKLIKKQ
ncbi:hypothetical protein [Gallibacterium sp. AGMB14963]|uniref:hypothetical protein n=1 Tax=Gallibacterium faecale TaxID=3019086 RepID=UPI0022F17AA5|nr:hypothetical protein [Gallibacterium sp. AGMB14963]MDA3977698.1 hypothetical protein [Gallibacterium sp. AGMB14963]